jgi:YHS domain-containing protein
MLKFAIFIIAGFLLYKLIMGDQKKKMDTKQSRNEEMADSGEMVKDPVCGTYVSSDSDIRVKEGGTVHRFCSYECRDAFLEQKGQSDHEQ